MRSAIFADGNAIYMSYMPCRILSRGQPASTTSLNTELRFPRMPMINSRHQKKLWFLAKALQHGFRISSVGKANTWDANFNVTTLMPVEISYSYHKLTLIYSSCFTDEWQITIMMT